MSAIRLKYDPFISITILNSFSSIYFNTQSHREQKKYVRPVFTRFFKEKVTSKIRRLYECHANLSQNLDSKYIKRVVSHIVYKS